MEEKKNKGGFKKKLLHVCPVQQSAQKAYGQQYDHVAREISVKRTGLDMTILWDVPTLTLMTHIRGIIWKFDSEGKGRIMMIRCVFWKNVVLWWLAMNDGEMGEWLVGRWARWEREWALGRLRACLEREIMRWHCSSDERKMHVWFGRDLWDWTGWPAGSVLSLFVSCVLSSPWSSWLRGLKLATVLNHASCCKDPLEIKERKSNCTLTVPQMVARCSNRKLARVKHISCFFIIQPRVFWWA